MNKKWFLFGLMGLILTFGLGFRVVLGGGVGDSQVFSFYSDFLDAKTSMKYVIETDYRPNMNSLKKESTDIYLFTPAYAYQKTEDSYNGYMPNAVERLVVFDSEGNQSYFRTYLANKEFVNSREQIPFFQSDDPDVYEAVSSFLDNPMFCLDSLAESTLTGIDLNVATLSPESRKFIENVLRRMVPTATVPESGIITYTFETDGTVITRVVADYEALFEEVGTFRQTITLTPSATLDVGTLVTGAVDVTEISDWDETTLRKLEPDQSVAFQYEFATTAAEYVFLRIETAGEFVFTTTDDNLEVAPIWFLYDFNLHQYRPTLTYDNSEMSKAEQTTLYLDPGFYYLYLRPRRVNMHSAEISYSFQGLPDDCLGGIGPTLPSLTETAVVTFSTDYPFDVDAVRITGNFDILIVEHEKDISLAIETRVIILKPRIFAITIPNPGFDFLLYFTSATVGSHQVSVSFYSYTDTPIPLSEAPLLDIFAEGAGTFPALPFHGNEDRYAIDLAEDSELYAACTYANLRILDAEGELVEPIRTRFYELPAGRYYVVLDQFTAIPVKFNLTPEPQGEEIRILDPSSGRMQIHGFVSSLEDIDLYMVTFATETTLRFPRSLMGEMVLIYGVDNPFLEVMKWSTAEELVIPAGTYYLTLPQTAGAKYINPYNFVIEIVPTEEGGE